MNSTTTLPAPTVPPPPAPARWKIIVAVHGIGDQVQNGTILEVFSQFTRNFGRAHRLPLGRFYGGAVPVALGEHTEHPFAFAEIHWADIPRIIVRRGYVLEETKECATRAVERLEFTTGSAGRGVNYQLASRVVEEMIETIRLIETMAFLARKAGLANFSLNEILSDYVNDVQVVAEFERLRGRILGRFDSQMERLAAAYPDAEFHVVAHSEGTVVSYLALLHAMWQNKTPAWLDQVKGYMTLGSPIDKHIILWSDLFGFEGQCPHRARDTIQWHNYYDFGDPVGFNLDTAREWMGRHGVTTFNFPPEHDHGFSRYYLPGKAHNDYWGDPEVFDHFINTVVRAGEEPGDGDDKARRETSPPPDRKLVWLVTYFVSYSIPLTLLFAGVYAVEKSVLAFNQMSVLPLRFAGDVIGVAFLIAGLTLLARIPRLVNPHLKGSQKWFWIAGALFVVCSAIYWKCASLTTRDALAALPGFLLEKAGVTDAGDALLTAATIGFVCLLSVVVAWWSRLYPRAGMKPLMLWGGGTATLMIFILLNNKQEEPPSIWPVATALTALLALWWLAALLFDLIFVWHRYIRHEAATQHLRRVCKPM